MSNFKSAAKRVGYDQEEAFFHRENQKLINKTKKRSTESADNVITLPFGRASSSAQEDDPIVPLKKVA